MGVQNHPETILTYGTVYTVNMAVIQPSFSSLLALYTPDYTCTIWSCPFSRLGPLMELQVSSSPKLVTLIISYLLFCRSECIFNVSSFFFSRFELISFIALASLNSITHCAVHKSVLQTALYHCSVVARTSLSPTVSGSRLPSPLSIWLSSGPLG